MHVHTHARTHMARTQTCHPYWPTSIDSIGHYGKLLVTLMSEKEDKDKEFIIRKFEIAEKKVYYNDEIEFDHVPTNHITCRSCHR